jgi:hypothetical protein
MNLDKIVIPSEIAVGKTRVMVDAKYILDLIDQIEGEAAFEGLPETKQDMILNLKDEIMKWNISN